MVNINGTKVDAANKNVLTYLKENGFNLNAIALEINGDIVPKSKYESKFFGDGDNVIVVSFVGGG